MCALTPRDEIGVTVSTSSGPFAGTVMESSSFLMKLEIPAVNIYSEFSDLNLISNPVSNV